MLAYTPRSWQFAVLLEENSDALGQKAEAVLGSINYTLKKVSLNVQYGESDIIQNEGETFSIGIHYHLTEKCKLYGFYTADAGRVDIAAPETSRNIVGLGLLARFH